MSLTNSPNGQNLNSGSIGQADLVGKAGNFSSILAEVRARMAQIPHRSTMSQDQLQVLVERELADILRLNNAGPPEWDQRRLRQEVLNDLLGFGLLQSYLDDPAITEIMINGHDQVFVESQGVIHSVTSAFDDEEHLRRIIDRMVRSSGRRVDQASPMVDARLPDGSRLNVILPPLAVDGASVTIRKFTSSPLTTQDLVASKSLSAAAAEFLQRAVASRLNILVSGGTGTGKTTMLNILSSFIGRNERVITVEDAVELTLQLENLVRLETRPANSEGAGEIVVRDLVRNALRMRPDRIVVGEVRGSETIDMLQAMNTGHEGSLSTVHANSPRDALRRLETMVLLGGVELPLRAIREQVAASIDLVVHVTRDATGRRYVQTLTEVVGMEGEVVSTADLFARSTATMAWSEDLDNVDLAAELGELLPTAVTSMRMRSRRASPIPNGARPETVVS
jgi:pilus assembly protein CpaF